MPSVLRIGGPPIPFWLRANACAHWIELDVRGGNRHLLIRDDRNGPISLLKQLSCRATTRVAKLRVSLSEVANKPRELQVVAWRNNEMNVIGHQGHGVNGNALTLAALKQATEEEVLFAGVREETPTIVAAQNDMVGVVRMHEETSR